MVILIIIVFMFFVTGLLIDECLARVNTKYLPNVLSFSGEFLEFFLGIRFLFYNFYSDDYVFFQFSFRASYKIFKNIKWELRLSKPCGYWEFNVRRK